MQVTNGDVGSFRTGVSLSAFRSPSEVEAFREASQVGGRPDPLFELAYTLDRCSLDGLASIKGRTLSIHAPCPGGVHFPNFGSADPAVRAESLETLRQSAETAMEFGAGILVLHPGYTTDLPVFVDTAKRLAGIDAGTAEEAEWIWVGEGSICRPGYCLSPLYRRHMEIALEGLAVAAELSAEAGVLLAVENLNPRMSYLFQVPEEFTVLARHVPAIRFCVDLGHLWISSLVHGFDFVEGLGEILATGRVVTSHIHDNDSRPGERAGAPPHCGDDHARIGSGKVPIEAALRLLRNAGVANLIVETKAEARDSLDRLERMIIGLGAS